jgi:hypothetical protein
VVAEVGNSTVSVDLSWALPDRVLQKTTAVIILIEYSDPGWDELHLIHLQNLAAFLLSLRRELIRRKLIDVSHYLLALLGQQVTQYILDAFGVDDESILLGIVK